MIYCFLFIFTQYLNSGKNKSIYGIMHTYIHIIYIYIYIDEEITIEEINQLGRAFYRPKYSENSHDICIRLYKTFSITPLPLDRITIADYEQTATTYYYFLNWLYLYIKQNSINFPFLGEILAKILCVLSKRGICYHDMTKFPYNKNRSEIIELKQIIGEVIGKAWRPVKSKVDMENIKILLKQRGFLCDPNPNYDELIGDKDNTLNMGNNIVKIRDYLPTVIPIQLHQAPLCAQIYNELNNNNISTNNNTPFELKSEIHPDSSINLEWDDGSTILYPVETIQQEGKSLFLSIGDNESDTLSLSL